MNLARRFSPDILQIDLDVNRTYRDHIDFRERYGERQVMPFNALAATLFTTVRSPTLRASVWVTWRPTGSPGTS